MLEELFGSKTRSKLLFLFLHKPNEHFYVREITRLINERLNSVRRELANLEKFGLIVSQSDNQKRYYFINQAWPIYKELSDLIIGAKKLKFQNIGQDFSKLKELKKVILTGRFTEQDVSIDVLLVGEISEKNISKLVTELESLLDEQLRYALMTEKEFKQRQELTDRFIYNIINNPKIVLFDKPLN